MLLLSHIIYELIGGSHSNLVLHLFNEGICGNFPCIKPLECLIERSRSLVCELSPSYSIKTTLELLDVVVEVLTTLSLELLRFFEVWLAMMIINKLI